MKIQKSEIINTIEIANLPRLNKSPIFLNFKFAKIIHFFNQNKL